MALIITFLRRGLWSTLSALIMGLLVAGFVYAYLESHLPDIDNLKDVQLQVPLRIYTADDQLIAEFGEKRRIPITLDQVPQDLVHAVLATEDRRFFDHPGVDVRGLARAAVRLLRTGNRAQGGSTITMQVARNFYLSRKKTFLRKINEILLAIRIDNELSKEKILELYFNKIYFGHRAYGVAAAAQVYYGKPLSQLTLPELAMLAGLPKAPSRINPLTNPQAALKRRNHVLSRMLEEHYIDQQQFETASKQPLTAKYHGPIKTLHAPYVAEMIRLAAKKQYGKKLYSLGLNVHTTINSQLQLHANKALHKGLLQYDRRHGYRGPLQNVANKPAEKWVDVLKHHRAPRGFETAVVTGLTEDTVEALVASGETITIPWAGLQWARKAYQKGLVGVAPEKASDILRAGDVIVIHQTDGHWALTQSPEVEGALVSLQADTGAIQALVGGFDFSQSHFNRATQARRQAGSAFKPFIYSAALAAGNTLATVYNDAPIVQEDASLDSLWRPENHSHKFYGPTRLRTALVKSQNLVSIRLLQAIGVDYAVNFSEHFGFERKQLPKSLSLALGATHITPVQLAGGYAVFANGGYPVTPYLIERIENAKGEVLFAHEQPQVDPILNPQTAFLMTDALQDVIQSGTGRGAKRLGRNDLAGKTGSTNDNFDAWFAGFNRDLVTVSWMGFDEPQSLYEYAARSALPMWIDFMGAALKGKPNHKLAEPKGLVRVKVEALTNHPARFEIFREQFAPKKKNELTTTVSANDPNEAPETEVTEHLF